MSHDVPEQHKMIRSRDFTAQKMEKGLSGDASGTDEQI